MQVEDYTGIVEPFMQEFIGARTWLDVGVYGRENSPRRSLATTSKGTWVTISNNKCAAHRTFLFILNLNQNLFTLINRFGTCYRRQTAYRCEYVEAANPKIISLVALRTRPSSKHKNKQKHIRSKLEMRSL